MFEIMGAAGLNLWRNRLRHGMDGADAHGSFIIVRIVIHIIFVIFAQLH